MYPFYINDKNCGSLRIYPDEGGGVLLVADCDEAACGNGIVFRAYACTENGRWIKLGIMEPVKNRMIVRKKFTRLQIQTEKFDYRAITCGRGCRLGEEPDSMAPDAFGKELGQEGWRKVSELNDVFKDPVMKRALDSDEGVLIKRFGQMTAIAEEFDKERPLKLAPAMCLADMCMIDGKEYMLIWCGEDGMPAMRK